MDMQNKKMIVFDMDGVILDSEPLHENARQMMFQKYNITPDDSFPPPVGNSSSGFWRQVFALCGLEGDAYELEAEQYYLVAKQIKDNDLPPSDGLLDVILWAKAQGMKVGLASSSTRILVDDVLDLMKLREFFDYTVSGDEIARKKPAPDAYLKVLELAGLPAETAMAVEDSGSGVAAAKAAGLYCFGYDNPTSGEQDLSKADRIIKQLKEIIEERK